MHFISENNKSSVLHCCMHAWICPENSDVPVCHAAAISVRIPPIRISLQSVAGIPEWWSCAGPCFVCRNTFWNARTNERSSAVRRRWWINRINYLLFIKAAATGKVTQNKTDNRRVLRRTCSTSSSISTERRCCLFLFSSAMGRIWTGSRRMARLAWWSYI